MRSIIISLVLVLGVQICYSEYNKLVWKDCGGSGAVVTNVDLKPMPLINPGAATLTLNATLSVAINTVGISLNITRIVSGIKLPINCYVTNGVNVGSCYYQDMCAFLQTSYSAFKPETCPPKLLPHGIDCRCPFQIAARTLDVQDLPLDIPDASQTAATFLASGDFNITVKVFQGTTQTNLLGCGDIALTIKKAKAQ